MSNNNKINIPISKTILKENDISSVSETLRSGWLVQGKNVAEFESKWCEFTGASNSVAVTSCTSALYLSLAALNFTLEDEAIVPAFTWISSANVVEHLGGKVKFCDIDLNTFNLDPSKLESCITSKTKVIIVVHLFGLSADMDEIIKIANKYKLKIIEDAACGFGSLYNKKHVGNFGYTGCFSFHPRKAITTGEGGMITTNDSVLAKKLRTLRDHGAHITDYQRHHGSKPYQLAEFPEAGFNLRMTDFQAVLGSSQMNRAKEILEERSFIGKTYNKLFENLSWLKVSEYNQKYVHGYQSYPCIFMPEEITIKSIKDINKKRNQFMEYLQEKGISTRPATHAIHMLGYYKKKYKFKPEDFPNAYAANDCSISFPLYNGLTLDEQNYVVKNVINYNF